MAIWHQLRSATIEIKIEDRMLRGGCRRDSLSLVKPFLFSLGVSRGDISLFQRKRSEVMKGDEPLVSAEGFHWREADLSLPITANE